VLLIPFCSPCCCCCCCRVLPIPFLFTGYSPVVAPAMWEFTLVRSQTAVSGLCA
jgi:hypothetical protein